MNNPRFTIYRLKIEPFMSGAPISEDVAEKVAEYILAHLMDIKFVDGNGEPIITYGSEVFDTLGYVTIEKKKKMTIDMKECRKQEEFQPIPILRLCWMPENLRKKVFSLVFKTSQSVLLILIPLEKDLRSTGVRPFGMNSIVM